MESLYEGKCKTCLSSLNGLGSRISTEHRDVILKCIPDMVNSISQEDEICQICIRSLNIFLDFLKRCLEVEFERNKKFQKEELGDTKPKATNIKDFLELFDSYSDEGNNVPDVDHSYVLLQQEEPPLEETRPGEDVNSITGNKLLNVPQVVVKLVENDNDGDHCYQRSGMDIKSTDKINLKYDLDRGVSLTLEKGEVYSSLLDSFKKSGVAVSDISTENHPSRKKRILLLGTAEITCYTCPKCSRSYRLVSHLLRHLLHCDNTDTTRTGRAKCQHCQKRFRRATQLTFHLKNDHLQCRHCKSVFNSKDESLEHSKICFKTYPCKTCGQEFEKPEKLKTHRVKVHREKVEERPRLCDICGKEFRTTTALGAHRMTHTDAARCDICGKMMKNAMVLKQHRRLMHTPRVPVQCAQCGLVFKSGAALRRHEATHDKNRERIPCDYCSATFGTTTGLKNHVQLKHGTGRVFECHICGRQLARKDYLKLHLMRHEGVKLPNYKIRNYSNGPGEEVTTCPVCKENFRSTGGFNKHMKTHGLKARKFKCEFCSQSFHWKNNLTRHEKLHEGKLKYRCRICFVKKFETEDEMLDHESSHNRTKKYTCSICNESFARKYILTNHGIQEHGIIESESARDDKHKYLEDECFLAQQVLVEETSAMSEDNLVIQYN